MNPFLLKENDYHFMYDTLINNYRGQQGIHTKVTHDFFQFFNSVTTHQFMTQPQLHELLLAEEFKKLPKIEINNVEHFSHWIKPDLYRYQESLYHYFKKQGWDISEYIKDIACNEHLSAAVKDVRHRYVFTYAKALQTNLFHNSNQQEILHVYDYLDKKVKNISHRLLFLLSTAFPTSESAGDELYGRLNRLLLKQETIPDEDFKSIFQKIDSKNVSDNKYPKLKNALLFNGKFETSTEGVYMDIHFQPQKIAQHYHVNLNVILKCFNDIEKYFKKQLNEPSGLLKSYTMKKEPEVITISTHFDNHEAKLKWKSQFDELFNVLKEQKFELPVNNIVYKLNLSNNLNAILQKPEKPETRFKL